MPLKQGEKMQQKNFKLKLKKKMNFLAPMIANDVEKRITKTKSPRLFFSSKKIICGLKISHKIKKK